MTQIQVMAMLTGTPNSVIQAKSPTTYTYYEPSGNTDTEVSPSPGTVGSSSTVTTTYTYNLLGDVTSVTTPGNNATTAITMAYGYGSSPQKQECLTATDALSHTTTYTYDSLGNKTSVVDALGNETDYSYVDPNTANGGVNVGQLNSVTYPPTTSISTNRAEVVSTYLYPGGPKLKDVTYTETGSAYREVDYGYGSEGEGLSVSGSTEPASYTYDDLYRVLTLVDGNSNTTHYYYNSRGYLNAMIYPGYSGSTPMYSSSTGMWTGISGADTVLYSSYDDIGNVTSKVDGRGVTTSYTYSDPNSLLTNVHYTLPSSPPSSLVGTPDVNATYDNFARIITIDNGIIKTTFGPSSSNGYDDDDNVLNVQTSYYNSAGSIILFSATVSYSYYPNNSRETMSAGSNMFTYTYDAAGRPAGLVNPFYETTSWEYGNNNWLASQKDYNSSSSLVTTVSYAYNARGFVTDLANTDPSGSTISEFGSTNPTYAMAYDAAGNRITMTVNDAAATGYSGTTSYTYDSRDELTQEASTRNSAYTNNFTYDGAENPTEFRNSTIASANFDNQIPVTSTYVYDGSGNPTTYAGNSLVFDPENRMTSFGTVESNGYTPDSLRAWKSNSSGTTYFLYDNDTLICELNSSGTVIAINTVGVNGLISRNALSDSTFYAFDPQGSTSQRLNSSGTALSSTMTDAFGSATDPISSDPYSGYCAQHGYYIDSGIDLQLLSHRFYDPSAGRFVTRDLLGYSGGINLYCYTQNESTNSIDPTGESISTMPSDPYQECWDECCDELKSDEAYCRKLKGSPNEKRECWVKAYAKQAMCIANCGRQFPRHAIQDCLPHLPPIHIPPLPNPFPNPNPSHPYLPPIWPWPVPPIPALVDNSTESKASQ